MKAELTDLSSESLDPVLMGLSCCSAEDFAIGVVTTAMVSTMSLEVAAVIVLLFFATGVVASPTASTMLSVLIAGVIAGVTVSFLFLETWRGEFRVGSGLGFFVSGVFLLCLPILSGCWNTSTAGWEFVSSL